jgi:hypothetical protein
MVWNFVLIGFLAALSSVVRLQRIGERWHALFWVTDRCRSPVAPNGVGSGSVISTFGGRPHCDPIVAQSVCLGHQGDTAMVNL